MQPHFATDLINNYDIGEVERHLIYSFLVKSNLKFEKSELIQDYFLNFKENSNLLNNVNKLSLLTLKELENVLELIIPNNDRKLNGAFFTPPYIVRFVLQELKPEKNAQILDPSCGSGAFLLGLVDYFQSTYNKFVKEVIQENIFAADILHYNVQRSKLLLTILGLQNNETIKDNDFNIKQQDSLRAKWEKQYDYVIGNPPYVKFQDLSDENRFFLSKNWQTINNGTFNLYFAFFELGYKLLNENGKLGYITPNNYFTSLAGESLRIFFQRTKSIYRIIDFGSKKVFDAQTYTALTFLSKRENNTIYFDKIYKNEMPELFLTHANGSPNDIQNLNSKKWRLLKTSEQNNIKLIETIGTPISRLFDICVGIATLKDELYFIDGTKFENEFYEKIWNGKKYLIENSITKPVYKISDFKNQEELLANQRRIICPYRLEKKAATPISMEEMRMKFPCCLAYFEAVKEALQARDKGKKHYDPFYIWGRSQGLTRTGKRWLTPTFSQKPRFLFTEEENSFFTNGYGLFLKKSEVLFNDLFSANNHQTQKLFINIIQKVLNSTIMHYYISHTSISIEGGYPCYQKNFIERFTIPEFTKKEMQILFQIEDPLEIDSFLIQKYGLVFETESLGIYVE